MREPGSRQPSVRIPERGVRRAGHPRQRQYLGCRRFSRSGTLCLFNPDGTNQVVWVLARKSLDILGTFGRNGRNAGQFHWVHNLATDSQGNIYTAEVDTGKRAQKFEPDGDRDDGDGQRTVRDTRACQARNG